MAWPGPPGQWNSAVPMAAGADMSMGSYTPEQWTLMQQQSWQWAQWQQQYAQWQNQYGDKYNQQLQGMQAMGLTAPLPTGNVPPPAPPPPDKPPPPPHENDEPLFGKPKRPEPVPAPNSNYGPGSDRTGYQKVPNEDNKLQPAANTEALKKLAEEERIFDIQFQKWEEEIEKWKQENVNHPDKRAYSEYEQKFEACRAQLMERRQQMKLKRDRLLGNMPQSTSNSNTGNKSKTAPPQQYKPNNYTLSAPPIQQGRASNNNANANNRNQQQAQYNMAQHNYNRDNRNVNPNDQYESYDNHDSNDCYMQDDMGTVIEDDSTFLPSGASAKGIPGLDLVPEQNDVIEIPDDQHNQQKESKDYYNHPQQNAPDYSTISQGINNILGDEKIMNILTMMSGQNNMGKNQNNYSNVNAPPNQPPPPPNQWGRNDNNFRQQNDFNNQNANYPQSNQQNQFNSSMHQQGNYNLNVDSYNNQGNQYGGQNVARNAPQPLMQINTQVRPPNMPQKRPEYPQGPHRRGPNSQENWGAYPDNQAYNEDYGVQDRDNPHVPNMPQMGLGERMQEQPPVMPPVKRKWVTEPLFTPSVIVEYEHKPLRLKAREFMEPVHTFDYNHVSKDGENVNKRKFEEEADEIFSKALRPGDKDWARDKHSKDYRDKPSRHESRSEFDSGRDVYHRRQYDDRRPEVRDRPSRFESPYRERDFDRTREPHDRNIGKDYERDRDFGRDRDLARERDYGRDRDLGRERDSGRDREFGRDRDSGMDRDFGRDRDRDRLYGRERDRDSGRDRDLDRDFGRDKYMDKRDRNRSHSRDRDSRKRALSKESEVSNTSSKKTKSDSVKPKHIVMIDDILEHPGRDMRPSKIVIVLRGPPGSGKSYLAKLIRDREAEYGGTARIMSIDDYFMQEGEVEEEDPSTGKMVKKPLLKYEYEESLEESYTNSLKRAFKRSITDGYFSFLIYDAVNDQLKGYADIWNFARQNGFQVYICTMELDPQVCFKRNIHNRKLEDIEVICSRFFATPAHHIQLDATTLLQSASITDVQMEDVSNNDIVEVPLDEEPEVESNFTSKWEKMDNANQLARLDGTSKPLRPSQLSMEDYLQLDDWKPTAAKPGKKTVRWADLEEKRQQEKMRAIGFVVGQTDWNRMTDPTMGSSALTQTKYIERVRRN